MADKVAELIQTSKAVDTDWFTSIGIEPGKVVKHTIQLMVATSTVVNIQYEAVSGTTLVMDLNNGSALTANALYVFDVVLTDTMVGYNIQHKTGTQNISCFIFKSDNSDL